MELWLSISCASDREEIVFISFCDWGGRACGISVYYLNISNILLDFANNPLSTLTFKTFNLRPLTM